MDLLFNAHPDMYFQTKCSVKCSHLSYADDVIIFTNYKEDGVTRLMHFLRRYEEMSGQKINYDKSSFPKKKAISIAHRIKSITGFVMKVLPITYLGRPLYKGNKRKALFENLIDKIRAKVIGWEHCHLSYGDRLQLIRSVLSSMPIYLLQVLNPPISTIQKLEQIFAKYFWSSNTQQRKIHWTKWYNICFPIDEGDLGIRNLRDMITAFSYKLWWRLRLNNSLGSKFTISKYCQGYFPSISKMFTTDLSIWKRICFSQKHKPIYFWSLGHGKTSFWHDWWIPVGTLANLVGIQCNLHIQGNWFWNNHEWDNQKLQQAMPPPNIIDLIKEVPINSHQPDCLYWKLSKHRAFTTKFAWEEIRNHQPVQPLYRSLWSKLIMPNIWIFAWIFIHNWIPVDDRLKQKGITLASKCCCCEAEETVLHLFLHNKQSLEVWGYFAAKFQINIPQTNDIASIIQSWKHRLSIKPHIRDVIPILILWNIWYLRNASKHEGVPFKANTIIRKTTTYLQNLYKSGLMKSEFIQGDFFAINSLHIPIQSKAHHQRATIVHWRKPQEGWFKLNTDGTSKGNPGISDAGGIPRDHLGRVIFAFQEPLGDTTNTKAELQAIYRGLQICIVRGLNNI
ncbi:UNVERIFIED_CONTAM: putative ribonuclease H protein [Sesamum latifolium]|uniref:Ribonuclease H protein n=1 Tax=Sesamum latifolium TaxID=2727402 RepID=A0AAW2XPV7_9LAMI